MVISSLWREKKSSDSNGERPIPKYFDWNSGLNVKTTLFSLDEQSFFHLSGLAGLYYIIFSKKSKNLKKTL